LKKLERAGVELTQKINQELRAKYQGGIDSKEAEELIANMTEKRPAPTEGRQEATG
jgi:hypothetical protein